jgi:hypothetical protein
MIPETASISKLWPEDYGAILLAGTDRSVTGGRGEMTFHRELIQRIG